MIPRKRKNKLNQKTLDSLKEPGTYFFNDAPGIAVRVSKNQKKSFYGSYSISKGVNAEGRIINIFLELESLLFPRLEKL